MKKKQLSEIQKEILRNDDSVRKEIWNEIEDLLENDKSIDFSAFSNEEREDIVLSYSKQVDEAIYYAAFAVYANIAMDISYSTN